MSFSAMLIIFISVANAAYFIPAYQADSLTVNPYNPMAIYVTEAKLNIGTNSLDLVAGDEIGIFDGTICVGAGVVGATIANDNMLTIYA